MRAITFFSALVTLLCLTACKQRTDAPNAVRLLKLISPEQIERCLEEAGVDKNRRPEVLYLGPGQYVVKYQLDGATMPVDCTRFLT